MRKPARARSTSRFISLRMWKRQTWCLACGKTSAITLGYSDDPSVVTPFTERPISLRYKKKRRVSPSVPSSEIWKATRFWVTGSTA